MAISLINSDNVHTVIESLRKLFKNLFKCFKQNQMEGSRYKCHLLLMVLRTEDLN